MARRLRPATALLLLPLLLAELRPAESDLPHPGVGGLLSGRLACNPAAHHPRWPALRVPVPAASAAAQRGAGRGLRRGGRHQRLPRGPQQLRPAAGRGLAALRRGPRRASHRLRRLLRQAARRNHPRGPAGHGAAQLHDAGAHSAHHRRQPVRSLPPESASATPARSSRRRRESWPRRPRRSSSTGVFVCPKFSRERFPSSMGWARECWAAWAMC